MVYDARRAEGYDDRHRDRAEEAEETAALLAEIHAAATERDGFPGRVLELGVGTGRLALPLARRGLEVHGVDSSSAMVSRLRDKPGGADMHVVIGDFSDLGSLVEGRYSLVFLAFNSLFEVTTQEGQIRCFAGVARHLTPGGAFVVEALAPEITRLEQSLVVRELNHDGLVLQATRHDPVRQVVTGQDVALAEGGLELSPWTIRYASVPELDLMARLAGLRLHDRWGGWHRQPFTAASSRHVSVYRWPESG